MAWKVGSTQRFRSGLVASIVAAGALASCSSGSGSPAKAEPVSIPSSGRAPGPTATPDVVDTTWARQVSAVCDQVQSGFAPAPQGGTPAAVEASAREHAQVLKAGHLFDSADFPASIDAVHLKVNALAGRALASYDKATQEAAAGNVAAAADLINAGNDLVSLVAQTWVLAGVERVGDPARLKTAELTVALKEQPQGLAAAFGSIWVAEIARSHVVRIDPQSGKLLATIEVGQGPGRLQAADGALWVRTKSEYVRIDPGRNAVTARLAKVAVGPAADKEYAVDGALWVLDGSNLHRYDPTTVSQAAAITLPGTFDLLGATDDLVVASTFGGGPSAGVASTAGASFIDPTTNKVIGSVKLPYAAGYPVILKDQVFFPGTAGNNAMVVDRSTWKVTATPKQSKIAGVGQSASDGKTLYVAAADGQSLMTFSATDFAPGAAVLPVQSFSVVVSDDRLWVSGGSVLDFLQRFPLAK